MSTATSPHQAQIERLLQLAHENNASEVRLSGGYAPMLRLGDQMRPLKTKPLAPEDVQAYAAAIMPPGADAKMFSFTSPVGSHTGSLIEIQGTKVLVLRVAGDAGAGAGSAAPAASGGGDIELDIADDPKPGQQGGDGHHDAFAMPKEAVGTIQIDKLLTAAVKNGVSDIHITAGLPPVFRIDGGMKPQATKVLTGDDTNGLMKAITPERCQAELAEKGGTDFGFAFKDLARFRVSVFKQRGSVAMVLRQ
jgi:Tfp pilus assembly ATPase PilU